MLVSPRLLLADAKAHNYAVAAFNFYNIDTCSAIIRAAEQEQSPIIAQMYEKHFNHYDGGSSITAAALDLIRRSPIPIALHLDHASRYDSILRAVRLGFTSVMYDGSSLPLEENIAQTAKVVEMAHSLDLYTEAELGRIARVGAADEHDAPQYTSVEEAVRLVTATGVDSLAPAIGTVHGLHRSTPDIQFGLLRALCEAMDAPIVMHGGSGIPDEQIREAIQCGVRKINVGTELKYTWSTTVHAGVEGGEKEVITLAAMATDAVREVAVRKIQLFGSAGRASAIRDQILKA